jgi:hypothetical protein
MGDLRVSGEFGLKMRVFSTFWQFSVNSGDAERVSEAVTTVLYARDAAEGCDSKTAPENSFFFECSAVGGCGDSGELARLVGNGGLETTL